MTKLVRRSEYPWWVTLSLWGVRGRRGLWVFVAISLASGLGLTMYGFWDAKFFRLGPVLALAAIPYWLSIRWIDKYGSWEGES